MNTKRFCRVMAPRAGAEPKILGTGFLLSPRRVLTAAHVIDNEPALLVRVEGGSPEPVLAKMLWEARDAEVDAALLELASPVEVPGSVPRLALSEIEPWGSWESFGYPRMVETSRIGIPAFSGALGGPSWQLLPAEKRLELKESRAAKTPDGWSGASGAAVFAAEWLVAVIREAHGEETNLLYATAVWTLAERAGFRDFLEDGEERHRRKSELIQQVAALLQANPNTANRLAEASSGGPLAAGELARRLCEDTQLGELIRVIERVRQRIAPTDPSGRAKFSQETASEVLVLYRLLAIVAPLACSSRHFAALQSSRGGLLRLDVATETLAELVLAGCEGRLAHFEPSPAPGVAPRPEALLNLPDPDDEVGILQGSPAAKLWSFLKCNEHLLQGTKKRLIPTQAPANLDQLMEALKAFNKRVDALAGSDREYPRRSFAFFSDLSKPAELSFAKLLEKQLGELILVDATANSPIDEESLQTLLGDFMNVYGQARRFAS